MQGGTAVGRPDRRWNEIKQKVKQDVTEGKRKQSESGMRNVMVG
jgi:hypothetical protein